MFECEIRVLHENGHRDQVYNDRGASHRFITIIYRGESGRWNHYDSFMRFDECSVEHENNRSSIIANSTCSDSAQIVSAGGRQCYVYKTRRDGNCLFLAIAHQLFPGVIGSSDVQGNASSIRAMVVQHLRQNISNARYRNMMMSRIETDYPQLVAHGQLEALDAFLWTLSSQNVWGGNECLVAVASMDLPR